MSSVSMHAEDGVLVLRFPYDSGLVAAVKSLPVSERSWDGNRKAWIIDPSAGQKVADMILSIRGESIRVPMIQAQKQETRILEIIYIGRCKDRSGEKSAFAMTADYKWSVLFPESVLRKWFEVDEENPTEQGNLFSVLGIKKDATDEEIRTGYRRMAKQWHPDLNRNDPDAQEQFIRIQEAYQILSNENTRARYIAGLMLEETLKQNTQYQSLDDILSKKYEYISPLRCGNILAEGVNKTGRFVVSKILEWQDIYNSAGQSLVTSWSSGDDKPTLTYV